MKRHTASHAPQARAVAKAVALSALTLVALSAAPSQAILRSGAHAPAGPAFREDTLLVRFRAGMSQRTAASVHRRVGARVTHQYPSIPGLELVTLPPGTSVASALDLYKRDSAVQYVEPDYVVTADVLPSDLRFAEQWALHNTGQEGGTIDADIDAPEAWDITTGSSNVVIGVIDTGIDASHPDLAPNLFRNEIECAANGLDDDSNGFVDDCNGADTVNDDGTPQDDNGHGTHVAGTIGAVSDNSLGVAGVSPNVRIVSCKFLDASGRGNTSDAIRCLDYFSALKDSGVPIVASNNSWGGSYPTAALADAIAAQRERDILFVAAAGNVPYDLPHYPASVPEPNVIAVAATDRNDDLATFSTFGRATVHVAAPGVSVLSTVGGDYHSASGTSMAAPHVAGTIALLKAADPARDWRALRNLVLAGGDPIPALADATVTGRRVNAAASLACSGRVVRSRVLPLRATVSASLGQPLVLAMQHNDCESPGGPIHVSVNDGDELVGLVDDGLAPDSEAGDGIYSAEWIPPAPGSFLLTYPGGEVVEVQASDSFLSNPAGTFSDMFGSVMASRGSRVLVAAPNARTSGVVTGAAHLFDTSTGDLLMSFENPAPGTDDRFSESIALSDDYVLIGAPIDDAGAENSGSAYLFDANTGTLLFTFSNPSPAPDDEFGFSVALTARHAFVGARLDDELGENAGIGYLFSIETGALESTLSDPDPGLDETFASAAAASGDSVIVTTNANDFDGVRLGNVNRYDADPTSPTFGEAVTNYYPGAPVVATPGVFPTSFGAFLAASDEYVVIGDPTAWIKTAGYGVDFLVFYGGGVHLYESDGDYLTTFGDPEREFGNYFGLAVAIHGDLVIVGSPVSNADGPGAGRAYAFDAATGQLRQVYRSPHPAAGDLLGVAVAATPDHVLIAARGNDSVGLEAGGVFRFDRPVLRTEQVCYTGSDVSAENFERVEAIVSDPFESRLTSFTKASGVCRSAASGPFSNVDPSAALVCYKARDFSGEAPFIERDFDLVNRFGEQRFTIRKSKSVCIPGGIDGSAISSNIDAYRCYGVKKGKDEIGFRDMTIAVDDAYLQSRVDVQKLESLCVAAAIGTSGIGSPSDHLACYRVRLARDELEFSGAIAQTEDTFGERELELQKRRTYCVPTSIAPVEDAVQ
jgi:subtilisin family serine protease